MQPHTTVKHRLLSYYLSIWTRILGSWRRNLIFWDCFAGRGDYSNGEPGSPLIAMEESERCFREGNAKGRPIELTCVFIEQRKDNYLYLRSLLRTLYPDEEGHRWRLYHGNFVDIYHNLRMVSNSEPFFQRDYPGLFFLDPYGFKGLPLSTVRHIMGRRRQEVMIVLMAETIKRFVNQSSNAQHFKDLFGVDDLSDLQRLAGESEPERKITEYYRSRLLAEDGARIKFVSQAFSMTPNRRSVILYSLIHGSNHQRGLELASETMRAISNNPDFAYKGKNNGTQPLDIFFGADPLEELADWIHEKYRGRTTTFEIVKLHCLETRPCSGSEVRRAILMLEDQGRITIWSPLGRTRRNRTLRHQLLTFST